MASYCSKCGKDIEEGTRYCPTCGHDTMGQESSYNSGGYNQSNNQSASGIYSAVYACGIVWAILALIVFIFYLAVGVFAASLGDISFGVGTLVGAILIGLGLIYLVSAIFAILCVTNVRNPAKSKNASIFCLIGSILAIVAGVMVLGIVGILSIIAGIIGIILFIMLRTELGKADKQPY